jgi:hypothetical protein
MDSACVFAAIAATDGIPSVAGQEIIRMAAVEAAP